MYHFFVSLNGKMAVLKGSFISIEFCRIPAIHHGEVKGQKESLLVPHGFRASVQCFALHRISSMFPMRCFKGEWSHIPKCNLGKCILLYEPRKCFLGVGGEGCSTKRCF